MMMKKRFLSGILALCMVLSLFAGGGTMPAFAEEIGPQALEAQIEVSQAEALPGEIVTLDVSISNNPGIMALILGLDYDTSRLLFQGYEEAGLTDWTVAEKAVWMGNSDNDYNGVILKLKFKVLDNAAVGLANVTVSCEEGDASTSLEQVVSMSVTSGGVTVKSVTHTHIPGEAVIENEVPSTCTEEGSYDEVIYCTECNAEISRTKVTVSKADHQYVNGVCKVCGAEEPGHHGDDRTAKLTVSSETAKPGETVTVEVSTENNPGIMALILGLNYDETVLTLEGYEDAGFTDWTVAEKAVWMGNSDNDYNGVILKLKFKVLDTAPEGFTEISLVCEEGDASTSQEEVVNFDVTAGGITVSNSGDEPGPGPGPGPEPEELPLPENIALDREYLLLTPGQKEFLKVTGIDEAWLETVVWSSDDESVATVSDGMVTAGEKGTAFVSASIETEGKIYSARCRIDVTDEISTEVTIDGVTLPVKKATVELFRTDYTRIPFVLNLEQNYDLQSNEEPSESGANNGAAVEEAFFTDSSTAQVFDLAVVDDRTLEIRPKDSFVHGDAAVLKTVKGSYKSAIKFIIDGQEYFTDQKNPISIAVKKTAAKISVKAVKFNSVLENDMQPLVFNGAAAADVQLNPDPPKGKVQPSWVELVQTDQGWELIQTKAADNNRTLYLLVTAEKYATPKAVTVSISAAETAPKLFFKPSAATVKVGTADTANIAVAVTPADVYEQYLGEIQILRVEEGSTRYLSENEWSKILNLSYGYQQTGISGEGYFLTVSQGSSPDMTTDHTYKVWLSLFGKEFPISVKTLAEKTAVTLGYKGSGSIDTGVAGSSYTVVLTPKNYNQPTDHDRFYVTRITGYDAKTKTEDPVTESFRYESVGNEISFEEAETGILTKDYSAYYAYIRLKTGAEPNESDPEVRAKLSVKFTEKEKVQRSVTLKARGLIDVIRPETAVTLTPTFRNCFTHVPEKKDLVFYKGAARVEVGNGEDNPYFNVDMAGNDYVITAKDDSGINYKTDKFAVGMRFIEDGTVVETKSPMNLTVKMGSAKFSQSTKEVTLLQNDRHSSGIIKIIVTDPTLSDIAAVGLDVKSADLFELRGIGSGTGTYAIHFKDEQVTTRKAQTVKIGVFLKGNETLQDAKPIANANISVKVNIG